MNSLGTEDGAGVTFTCVYKLQPTQTTSNSIEMFGSYAYNIYFRLLLVLYMYIYMSCAWALACETPIVCTSTCFY